MKEPGEWLSWLACSNFFGAGGGGGGWRATGALPFKAFEVTDPLHLEHWPLSATLRWLEYFGALDESLAKKDFGC